MARPYSQRGDLNMDERRLIELTDSDAAPGVPDEALITKLGVDADDVIDGFCAGMYAVPFDPVPPLIRLISRALRRMYLYEHRESIEMPATVRDGGKWALDTLEKIATPDGDMVLVGAARHGELGRPVADVWLGRSRHHAHLRAEEGSAGGLMAVAFRHSLEENWERSFAQVARRADNPMPAHRIVGEMLLGVVQDNFEAQGGPGERWPDLSDSTLLARARGRSGRGRVEYKRRRAADGERAVTPRAAAAILGAKALIWTGRLLRSETWQAARTYVDVGSNLVQAARLFFGSREGVKPVTPARNPFHLTDEVRQSIRETYARWFFGPLTGDGPLMGGRR
jgi:phage gpG-like protein/phage gp36-like protein